MKPLPLLILVLALGAGCAASSEHRAPKSSAPRRAASADLASTAQTAEILKETGVTPGLLDVYLDPGGETLGAYTIEVRYDPTVVTIDRILAPGPDGFPGMPMANTRSFTRGVTRILSLHALGEIRPGRILVARIVFRSVRPGSSSISTSVLNLYNPQGIAIPGAAVLSTHKVISRETAAAATPPVHENVPHKKE